MVIYITDDILRQICLDVLSTLQAFDITKQNNLTDKGVHFKNNNQILKTFVLCGLVLYFSDAIILKNMFVDERC